MWFKYILQKHSNYNKSHVLSYKEVCYEKEKLKYLDLNLAVNLSKLN